MNSAFPPSLLADLFTFAYLLAIECDMCLLIEGKILPCTYARGGNGGGDVIITNGGGVTGKSGEIF